jgi:hypothetical protein
MLSGLCRGMLAFYNQRKRVDAVDADVCYTSATNGLQVTCAPVASSDRGSREQ